MSASRDRLVSYLRKLPPHAHACLEDLKRKGERDRDRKAFVWHFLLQSFATMGNSRGADGLIRNSANYRAVSFGAIKQVPAEGRCQYIEAILRRAGVRMPIKKAGWLTENFRLIEKLGGLAEARRQAFAAPDTTEKIAFMKQFRGIGDKYARNIWMDVYHPDFRNSIAIDVRIKNVSEALGVSFRNYAAHEEFYQSIACEADIEPWELDRVLYLFSEKVVAMLKRPVQSDS